MRKEEVKTLFENQKLDEITDEKLIEILAFAEEQNASKDPAWSRAFGNNIKSSDVRKELEKRGYSSKTVYFKKDDEPITESKEAPKDIFEKIVKTKTEDAEKYTAMITKKNREALEEIYSKHPGCSRAALFNAILSEAIRLL